MMVMDMEHYCQTDGDGVSSVSDPRIRTLLACHLGQGSEEKVSVKSVIFIIFISFIFGVACFLSLYIGKEMVCFYVVFPSYK